MEPARSLGLKVNTQVLLSWADVAAAFRCEFPVAAGMAISLLRDRSGGDRHMRPVPDAVFVAACSSSVRVCVFDLRIGLVTGDWAR